MIKLINNFFCVLFLALLFTCSMSAQDAIESASKNSGKYSIASPEYEHLADKALHHLVKFELADFYNMISDDIQYYLPDGGEKSRTQFKGKKAFMNFWDNYQENSGNNMMELSNVVHVPLNVHEKLNYTNVTGVMVLSYFSLDMTYGEEIVDMRMNWGFHFDENKKIDGIWSYYDRTPIIEAAKKNMLAKGS